MFCIKNVAAVILIATTVPGISWACFPCLFGHCGTCGYSAAACVCAPCATCHLPPANCSCGGPVIPQPVVPTTTYVPQPVVTYRDIPQIQYQRQAYIEQVPVMAYQPVIETVLVPQQVTRMVPTTAYQAQTRYRDVAVQTTQRVYQTQTQYVPQQSLTYVPTIGAAYAPIVPAATAAAPVAIPSVATPRTASAESDWSTIPSRKSRTASSANSRFRPAPSAATVWRSQF